MVRWAYNRSSAPRKPTNFSTNIFLNKQPNQTSCCCLFLLCDFGEFPAFASIVGSIFVVFFGFFHNANSNKYSTKLTIDGQMMCLGLEPGAAIAEGTFESTELWYP